MAVAEAADILRFPPETAVLVVVVVAALIQRVLVILPLPFHLKEITAAVLLGEDMTLAEEEAHLLPAAMEPAQVPLAKGAMERPLLFLARP
jgi:hypothetical protein